MIKKIVFTVWVLSFLLPYDAFSQGACSMTACTKVTIQGSTGVDISNKSAGDIKLLQNIDATAKGITIAATTGEVTPVGSVGWTGALPVTGNLSSSGTITSSRTTDLGWAVVDGADNTACTTICTSAAVFGINLAAGATAPVIVGPADATADVCLCAGAS